MHKGVVLSLITVLLITGLIFLSTVLSQETQQTTTSTQETTSTTEPTTTQTTETVPSSQTTCPAPPAPPLCAENQGLSTKFDDKGCVIGYDCVEISRTEVGQVATCPEIQQPKIECTTNEQLSKITDDKGCVVGYNCVSTAVSPPEAPQVCPTLVPEKPSCDGSVVPVFDRGCLISYTCVPQGCSQETDQSGFIRVVCEHKTVCPGDSQQAEIRSKCYEQGGTPVPFNDHSGCVFYDCRFDNREINPNPISGYQKCPTREEEKNMIDRCRESGFAPSFIFEGGCKIVKCSQEAKPVCQYVAESEKTRIDNECSSHGLPVVRDIDKSGCAFYRCGESSQMTCQRNVPPEAYKKCDSIGGEMIAKTSRDGCVVFSECVMPGDDKYVRVEEPTEIPDATVLINLALKLEQLKIELDRLAVESREIEKYYGSVNSLDEERYKRVAAMFEAAADKVDEIRAKIRDNVDTMTIDDLVEIKHDIKYIKEVTLKDILYLMLSNSDDVKETLELSKKVSTESNFEDIERNAKDCGTDGSCFDRAIRSCKPVTFRPEGRSGPIISILGVEGGACVMRVTMTEGNIPPGFTKDSFFMDCRIKNYAIGVRGPEDVIPYCEGPMAKFAKERFGGTGEVSGQSFPPPEGGPGGCETVKECTEYCIDNYDECVKWTKEHPAYGSPPSLEELRRFKTSGFEEEFERGARFAGPGGCEGPEECDRFCRENPEECIKWCKENPDICPQERAKPLREFRQPSGEIKCPDGVCDEFERANPYECPQDCGEVSQEVQPSGVQACVGCLNNGICDIGECSECVDCLKSVQVPVR